MVERHQRKDLTLPKNLKVARARAAKVEGIVRKKTREFSDKKRQQ